jgi:sucrose-phosphate synthase
MTQHSHRYILLVSVHGLVRGDDLELGRDADTGGQVKYVIELARALIEHPRVEKVDLVTRRVSDQRVDASYAKPIEVLEPGVNIVRIPCGPNRYIAKESLWPHLDSFVDNTLQYLRSQGRPPDLVHGHYADAGYVASLLSGVMNIPMAFTGHSLGRVKHERLLEKGSKPESIEKRYRISRRIEAEENALDHAALVVASTTQEVEKQYALYDYYQPRRMLVIPPGVDLSRFSPPTRSWLRQPPILDRLRTFLDKWRKPMILALSRPDPRKNIATLLKAYGESPALREMANLVIVAGNRSDIRKMDKGAREVLNEILYLIDYYDLYGHVAYPKFHEPDDIPDLYRLAAKTKGVFVNPALTEPFGLTLLEAAASGLPVIATVDGGPCDILSYCKNGILFDPLDAEGLGEALHYALSDNGRWRKWSRSGVRGVHRHFSWNAHIKKYMKAAAMVIQQSERRRFYKPKSRLITADRILVSDIDNTLIGDKNALKQLLKMLKDAGEHVAFGVATGRSMELTLEALEEWKIPTPQFLITSVGSAIHYGPHLVQDKAWERHIHYRWRPDDLRNAMRKVPGLKLQPPKGQGDFKVSYNVDSKKIPSVEEIVRRLRRQRLHARVIYSHQAYLDLLPIRASKGMALRYFATKWGIPLDRCLVAGDSGNDEEMLTGNSLAVVVGNHDPELEKLRGEPFIYFAQGRYARGIIEGIAHYDFLGGMGQPQLETSQYVRIAQ